MKKKIASLLMALALLVSGVSAFAMDLDEAPDEVILFRYEDISSITPYLSVSGTTATYKLTVRGSANVTSLSAVLQLQKMNANGTFLDYGTSWTASSTSNYLYTYGTRPVDPIGTYRLKATVTAYTSTGSSTETAYS